MKPATVHRLGQLQLKILQVLWAQGESTVASVQGSLDEGRDLAYTTVATMLRKMEGRGLVEHRSEGRLFYYKAKVSEDDVTKGLAADLVDRLFSGSLSDLVSHLLTTQEVSRDELERIERLVAHRKKESSKPRRPGSIPRSEMPGD